MLAAIIPQPTLYVLILPLLLISSSLVGRLLAGPLARTPVHSPLERWFLYWMLGAGALSWVGTILAGLGLFRGWLLFIVMLTLIAWSNWNSIMAWRRGEAKMPNGHSAREQGDALPPTPRPVWLAVITVLAGAAWLFARPAASFFLMDDSAVYTMGGILLARTGSLFVPMDNFWITSPVFLRQFFSLDVFGLLSRYYGPLYQWTPAQSTLEIGFLPLPKVWMALVVWLFGPDLATWATPFWGLTGLAAVYSLTRRLLGWPAGLGAAILLGVSLPQIWFARYPISEIYTQALFWGGLYLVLLARQNAHDSSLAGALAWWGGLVLAALTILRFEGALLVLAVAGLVVVGWGWECAKKARWARIWLLTLVLAGGFGVALSVGVARHYFLAQSLSAFGPAMTRLALAALLGVLGGGGLVWRYRYDDRVRRLAAQFPRWLPWGVIGGWIAWIVLAGWHLYSRDWGDSLAGWLVQYWTPSGVALSTAGIVWLLWRQRSPQALPEFVALVGVAVFYLVGFSMNAYVYPWHPWAMRRLVPVVMPTLAIGAAGLLAIAAFHIRRVFSTVNWARWSGVGVLGGVFLFQACAIGQRSYPILFHHELNGLWAQLQSAAARFPANAVLLFDDGDVGQGIAPAMDLLWGRTALVLYQTPDADREAEVDDLIKTALAQNRPVYLMITNGDLAWQPEQWRLDSEGAIALETTVLRQRQGRPPLAGDIFQRTFWLDVYQIKPDAWPARPETSLPVSIPSGSGSYPYLRDGFYGWDMGVGNVIARWTDGNGVIVTPWLAADPNTPVDVCLRLHIAGGRPLDENPAHLTVTAEGVELFRGQLGKSFDPQWLTLPARSIDNRAAPQLEIHLISTTWTPPGDGDGRTVGVLFYGMELAPLSQCVAP